LGAQTIVDRRIGRNELSAIRTLLAFEGRRRGGEVFASFDRTAIRLIAETGGVTHLLSGEQPQPPG
jgi:hypothetical protein